MQVGGTTSQACPDYSCLWNSQRTHTTFALCNYSCRANQIADWCIHCREYTEGHTGRWHAQNLRQSGSSFCVSLMLLLGLWHRCDCLVNWLYAKITYWCVHLLAKFICTALIDPHGGKWLGFCCFFLCNKSVWLFFICGEGLGRWRIIGGRSSYIMRTMISEVKIRFSVALAFVRA